MATVLIVDDDTGIRSAVRAAVEDAGHSVREAADGEQALRQLQGARERMVALVDLRMPNVDGFELLRTVAEDWELAERHAYVILSADTASLPVVTALRSRTIVTSIAKPFDIDALLSAVEQAELQLTERPGTR